MNEKQEPAASDATDRRPIRRRHILGGFALVLVIAIVGALLGILVSSRLGTDTVVLAGITFGLSPVTMALYSAVAVATFLVTFLVVLWTVSAFDEA